MKTVVTLFTRNGCHLCEHAKVLLTELKQEFQFQYEEIDINESDELTELYGLMIPVVKIDGQEVQFGQIDKIFISDALIQKK